MPKLPLLSPICTQNSLAVDTARADFLWQVAGKVRVAGKERASNQDHLYKT